MKIKKRLLLLLGLTFVGGLLFIPFILAGDTSIQGGEVYRTAFIFLAVSLAATALAGWGGLVFSDKLNIGMPILRNWENGQRIPGDEARNILLYAVSAGTIAALCVIAGNYFMHPPTNPGGFFVRISTTVWASLVTETVSHLFLLSGLILLIKNRTISILLSALVFVILFHFNSTLSPGMEFYIGLCNFAAAVLTGYLFVRKGFEAAVLAHMVMHGLMLAVNK